jgi:predicted phage-related endonuclease
MQRLTYPSRDAWLADRHNRIGASESPGILGHGYANDSPLATYIKKVEPTLEEVIDETDRQRMDAGTLMEPVIAELFRRETGLVVERDPQTTVCVSGERPHVGCTLDGELVDNDGPAVWQAKNVGEYLAGEWKHDSIPLRVQIQEQHEMYVTGYPRAYIAALVGGNRLEWRVIERHDAFIRAMLPALDAFWEHVQKQQPPPPDASEATRRALHRLYAKETGETIELPDEAIEWDRQQSLYKGAIKRLKTKLTGVENQIKAVLKDATFGEIPGGGRFKWKVEPRRGHYVESSEPRILRRLKK